MRYCIIGAGAAGLAAARHLQEASIPFDVYERHSDVGGIWDIQASKSPVYRSTHLISSKRLTEFPDFPMPDSYPDYPNHELALRYLREYARHHDLYRHIRFHSEVVRAAHEAQGWTVQIHAEEPRRYSGLILASGFHMDPRIPKFPGRFDGQIIHSSRYKNPDLLRGKKVLVVGAGNSGCDIAVESAQNADRTFHSMRRGYYFIPKYVFGMPSDLLGEFSIRMRIPIGIRRILNRLLLRIVVGHPSQYGLPKPDHRLLEAHPIINSQILQHLGQGDIQPKPEIRELQGSHVLFSDGTREAVDLIILATGYLPTFPFLSDGAMNMREGLPNLFMHVFHPSRDDLFVLGMIQPDSGVWWLMDLQARLMAQFIRAHQNSSKSAERFKKIKAGPQPDLGGGLRYVKSERHFCEVEHSSYARKLNEFLKVFS